MSFMSSGSGGGGSFGDHLGAAISSASPVLGAIGSATGLTHPMTQQSQTVASQGLEPMQTQTVAQPSMSDLISGSTPHSSGGGGLGTLLKLFGL